MSQNSKLTPVEQAMLWERMSGERLSDAERKRIMAGGEFRPPDGTRDDIQVRAEEFVRDCFLLFGQDADAENAELVRSVAAKVRQSIP